MQQAVVGVSGEQGTVEIGEVDEVRLVPRAFL
jgi:hypothetical protein